MALTPAQKADRIIAILYRDEDRLRRIDNYIRGIHDRPYMPPKANDEYRMLVERATSNWMPLLIDTPAQALYVDGFRPGRALADGEDPIEWQMWEASGMSGRQLAVHRGALGYGHSFVIVEKRGSKTRMRGMSPFTTSAIYDDPANDIAPNAALTITRMPTMDKKSKGLAVLWDGRNRYDVEFEAYGDEPKARVSNARAHGNSECPVTRFAAQVDLEGRTIGVVEPNIALQNRINQTVLDLLLAQTYAAVKVRFASGMAPPVKTDPETGEAVLDENGQPIPLPINHNASRFLFSEDADVKFGSLDESPLDGFIASIDMSIRHLSAKSQTPPHHLLGQIANLSAEALQAAETALSRKVKEFSVTFGESWERVFRLAAELEGVDSAATDYDGEIIWADVEARSLAQSADALGKLKEQLGIPARGLWNRVPGVTQNEISEWERLFEEENPGMTLEQAIFRSTQSGSANNQPDLSPEIR